MRDANRATASHALAQRSLRASRPVRWVGLGLMFLALALAVLPWISVLLVFPTPSGPLPVGRVSLRWMETQRPEPMTDDPSDRREVVAHVWYPAAGRDGPRAPYLPDLDALQAEPRVAEAVGGSLLMLGLRLVPSHVLDAPPVAPGRFPVLLFSPGNETNVALYSALLNDLASHGYVIVAVDHPYDVAGVLLAGGRVAAFAEERWPEAVFGGRPEDNPRAQMYRERALARAADLVSALERVSALSVPLGAALDLDRVGVFGHSVGGIAAVEVCRADARVRACANLDGLFAGTPFGTHVDPQAPERPFLYLTKIHPALREIGTSPEAEIAFAAAQMPTYRVVLPEARHDSFSDGPLLQASLMPFDAPAAREQAAAIAAYTRAFFDTALLGQHSPLLEGEASLGGAMLEQFGQPR